jgi:hypothetical protein
MGGFTILLDENLASRNGAAASVLGIAGGAQGVRRWRITEFRPQRVLERTESVVSSVSAASYCSGIAGWTHNGDVLVRGLARTRILTRVTPRRDA